MGKIRVCGTTVSALSALSKGWDLFDVHFDLGKYYVLGILGDPDELRGWPVILYVGRRILMVLNVDFA